MLFFAEELIFEIQKKFKKKVLGLEIWIL